MRPLVLLFVAVAALALGLALWWRATTWAPDAAAFPVQGVAVSARQGAIDWPSLHAAGADFAYVEASDGGRRDPLFERNWAGAEAAGVRRGALHRFSLCQSVMDQLRAYLTTVPRSAGALPGTLALDFDARCVAHPRRRVVIDAIHAFLAAAEQRYGTAMLLRVSPAFEAEYAPAAVIARPLWAERTYFPPDYLPRPWRIWQATGIRRIEGAAGPVEWSVVAP